MQLLADGRATQHWVWCIGEGFSVTFWELWRFLSNVDYQCLIRWIGGFPRGGIMSQCGCFLLQMTVMSITGGNRRYCSSVKRCGFLCLNHRHFLCALWWNSPRKASSIFPNLLPHGSSLPVYQINDGQALTWFEATGCWDFSRGGWGPLRTGVSSNVSTLNTC